MGTRYTHLLVDVCAKFGWSVRNWNEGYAGNEGLWAIILF